MKAQEHVHFIGIGGYGMSAIAKVMLEMGYTVTGSDLAEQDLTRKLKDKGAHVFLGHHAENVKGADFVVYSTALPKDNVEMTAAGKLNIPILHRSQMLARLLNTRRGIAVAGAHGKTTTSSMIALVMEQTGMDPTYLIGGEIMNVGSNAKAGLGEYVVAEADESDGSFLQYRPTIGIVTNIEPDHLENYEGSYDKLKQAYRTFLGQVKPNGAAIVCSDDADLKELLPQLSGRIITYGTDSEAEYQAARIQLGDRKASFDVLHHGIRLGTIQLSVPGRHNVYNALATLIACLEAGLSFDQVAGAIRLFRGAKRRFQVLGDTKGILVIDDYAHHPTEIMATISAAKSTGKRIIAVFQPQRYSRTFFLLEAFSRAFGEADEVLITDIYSPAGEAQIEGISSRKLAEMIQVNSNPHVHYIPTKEEVSAYLALHTQPGDLVLTMGAGDIWKVAEGFARRLTDEE
jgi:UDP-N-acetylmuramate--alanine ligase